MSEHSADAEALGIKATLLSKIFIITQSHLILLPRINEYFVFMNYIDFSACIWATYDDCSA